MPILGYILSTGNEKAATENANMPNNAEADSDSRKFGSRPNINNAKP
jgi:hypothetical protein